MAHLNNVPEYRRQPLNCSLKQLFLLSSRATVFGTLSEIPGFPTIPNAEIIVGTAGRDLKVEALLPQKHERGVDRDACEP